MAIVNRALDPSEQLAEVVGPAPVTNLANGVSLLVGSVPWACTVSEVNQAINGVSGTPLVDFFIRRTSSSGATVFALGISGMVGSTFRTSYSGLAATGSTLLNLAAGDEIYARNVVANSSIEKLIVSFVVQKTQDILSYS